MPCVIYVRISRADIRALMRSARKGLTPEQREAALLEKVQMHLAEAEAYAADDGLDVIERFVEPNVSASRYRGNKRLPEREALMTWLGQRTGAVVVLTTEIERLFRDVGESLTMVDEARRLVSAGALHIVDTNGEDFDLTTPRGQESFMSAVVGAQHEAAKISERRRRRERRRAADGGYAGSGRPFGYDRERDEDGLPTGALTIREDEAGPLRDAADRIIAEAAARPDVSPSLGRIAAEWRAAGLTTVRGGQWDGEYLARVLRNPLYAGWRIHRPGTVFGRAPRTSAGVVTRGRWEPVLDQVTFDAVGRILADPRRRTNTDTRLKYALSGLAVCAACGTKMRVAPHRTSPGKALRCPPKPYGCGRICVRMEPVEDYVVEVVMWWLGAGGQYDAYLAAARETGGQAQARDRIAVIGAELAALAGQITEWEDELRRGFDREVARGLIAGIRADQARLSAERDGLGRRLAAAAAALPAAGEAAGPDWDAMTATARRDWLRGYADAVIIHPAGQGRPFDPRTVQVVPGAWWPAGAPVAYPAGLPPRPPREVPPCELPGCGEPLHAHGLCGMHNARRARAARNGHPDQWDRSPGRRPGYPRIAGGRFGARLP